MFYLTENHSMLGYELFASCPNMFHFVTTRRGGVGVGTYASFNCTDYVGDDVEAVKTNQCILRDSLPAFDEFVLPHQVHGIRCAVIDDRYSSLSALEKKAFVEGVDALVTDVKGTCLAISTADCVPILLYDRENEVIAAIHAGWRGTVNYIVKHTLDVMKQKFTTIPAQVLAAIGPSISLAAFEVGDEVYDAFNKAGFPMEKIAQRNNETSKWHLDLWMANKYILLQAGVPDAQIQIAGICTYEQYDEFFSARRLGIASGRILSGICLETNKE